MHAPGSGLTPLAFAALCAMVTGESLAWSGIGRSGTTSLTAGLPARYLASPGETVAETALISEKAFTLAAWVWLSCAITPLWIDLTSAARTAALLGVSATPVNWFLNTTITLSVTFGGQRRGLRRGQRRLDGGGRGRPRGRLRLSRRRQRYRRHGYQRNRGRDRGPAQ